eukprot:TRINITY_DN6052_c0_g4_i1.p1 TRINITY_DN6052_c0_g4~~TRINITY_DN6052_c0_g4_i1.p1  ORF type:complete len:472 (+),score=176.63 TRINITY_DN6052_c0_g4_i1:61-1476(+)
MADPTQGDTLMARKRANAAKRMQQQQQPTPAGAGRVAARTALPSTRATQRAAEASEAAPAAADAVVAAPTPPPGSAAEQDECTLRSTDKRALVRAQLVVDPAPLPLPPDNWDEEERRVGEGGRTYTKAQYVPLLGSQTEWDALPPVKTGDYFRSKHKGKHRDSAQPHADGPATVPTPADDPFPFRVLGPRDFYYRPDLDDVSQRVVIESLRKQREEELDRKAAMEFNRRVQLAKFDAQRRARIELQLRSGLKVEPQLLQAYRLSLDELMGYQGSPGGGVGEQGKGFARQRRDGEREETQQAWFRSCELRIERNLVHREYCRQKLAERKQGRHLLEASLGTHYARAKTQLLTNHGLGDTVRRLAPSGGALAVSCPTFDQLHQSKASSKRSQMKGDEEAREKERLVAELDRFDEELFSDLSGPKKPRQRGLPYSSAAPYKTCKPQPRDRRQREPPGHVPPIVLPPSERAVCSE